MENDPLPLSFNKNNPIPPIFQQIRPLPLIFEQKRPTPTILIFFPLIFHQSNLYSPVFQL